MWGRAIVPAKDPIVSVPLSYASALDRYAAPLPRRNLRRYKVGA